MEDKYTRIRLIERIMQLDIGARGIQSVEHENLCSCTADQLYRAASAIASLSAGSTIGILTGFYIPHGTPPAPESDGPPGAISLARGLNQLGYKTLLLTDEYSENVLHRSFDFFKGDLQNTIPVIFPVKNGFLASDEFDATFIDKFFQRYDELSCLISVERVGPSHDLQSLFSQNGNDDSLYKLFSEYGPGNFAGHCLNMKAESVDRFTAPTHLLFEHIYQNKLPIQTIGIGDGGNEIGMGSIPWHVIQKNINSGVGGKIACRIPTDFTVVAGVSNWGALALLAAITVLFDKKSVFLDFITEKKETAFLAYLTDHQLVVDGVFGYPSVSVDGIDWDVHLAILKLIRSAL